MQEDIWFEEELLLSENAAEEVVTKTLESGVSVVDLNIIKKSPLSILRVHQPRWERLNPAVGKVLSSGTNTRFYLVRLGFEFEISKEARDKGIRFIYARCAANLWATNEVQSYPKVYDMFPRDIYEGTPKQVTVELGPEFKLGQAEYSLGKIHADIYLGTIEPVIVGWLGENEREPYWELRPKQKALLGVKHLWLVIEVPEECKNIRLAVRVEGDVQSNLIGIIPIGPKSHDWASRPSVLIE